MFRKIDLSMKMRKRGEKDVVEELGAGYVMEAMGRGRGRLKIRATSARLRGFLWF